MTAQVRLVPVTAAHVPVWNRWRAEASSRALMPLDDVPDDDLLRRLAWTRSDFSQRSVTQYRWIVEADGAPVGTVVVKDVSWTHLVGEVGYMLSEAARGRGIGTAAIGQLVDKAFGEGGLHRLWLLTATTNEPSRRLAERLGFRHEGVLREHVLVQNRRMDQAVYGLLRSEWQPRP